MEGPRRAAAPPDAVAPAARQRRGGRPAARGPGIPEWDARRHAPSGASAGGSIRAPEVAEARLGGGSAAAAGDGLGALFAPIFGRHAALDAETGPEVLRPAAQRATSVPSGLLSSIRSTLTGGAARPRTRTWDGGGAAVPRYRTTVEAAAMKMSILHGGVWDRDDSGDDSGSEDDSEDDSENDAEGGAGPPGSVAGPGSNPDDGSEGGGAADESRGAEDRGSGVPWGPGGPLGPGGPGGPGDGKEADEEEEEELAAAGAPHPLPDGAPNPPGHTPNPPGPGASRDPSPLSFDPRAPSPVEERRLRTRSGSIPAESLPRLFPPASMKMWHLLCALEDENRAAGINPYNDPEHLRTILFTGLSPSDRRSLSSAFAASRTRRELRAALDRHGPALRGLPLPKGSDVRNVKLEQALKDLAREKVYVNGVDVLQKLSVSSDPQLAFEALWGSVEACVARMAFARGRADRIYSLSHRVCRAMSRTTSGGDAYFAAQALLCAEDRVITPSRVQSSPIVVTIEDSGLVEVRVPNQFDLHAMSALVLSPGSAQEGEASGPAGPADLLRSLPSGGSFSAADARRRPSATLRPIITLDALVVEQVDLSVRPCAHCRTLSVSVFGREYSLGRENSLTRQDTAGDRAPPEERTNA